MSRRTRAADDFEKAQVGIGTLVVFVSMVLVAAIASGVLINTAGILETRSQSTGKESVDQVSKRLDVVSKSGNVTTASEYVNVTVYNDTHLKLIGDDNLNGYEYEKGELLLEEGDPIELGGVDGPATYHYGDVSITFSGDYLIGTSPPYASVSFEVVDNGGDVILYDETNGKEVGQVDPPVEMYVSQVSEINYRRSGEAGWEYEIGETESSSPPAGSSYVLNQTEEEERDGPLHVVENVSMTVQPTPGSSALDLENVTIYYLTDRETATLTYTNGTPTGDTFTVDSVTSSGTTLLPGEKATIRFNTTSLGDENVSLQPGDSARLRIVTASGGTTQSILDVPPSLVNENEIVL